MRWAPPGYGGERRPPEKVKQDGWREQGLLAVFVDDKRLIWPERVVWLRAAGQRWKPICWKVGLERAAANEHFQYALCVIAWRLNGRRRISSGSRRSVIAAARGAASTGR